MSGEEEVVLPSKHLLQDDDIAKKDVVEEKDINVRESTVLYIAILISTIGSMCYGYTLCYTSPTLVDADKCHDWDNSDWDTNKEALNCRMGITDKKFMGIEGKDWFGSIINLGAAFCACFANPVANKLGLKTGMLCGYTLMLIGYLLLFLVPKPGHSDFCQASTGKCGYKEGNLPMLISSRFIIGMGAGFLTCCTAPYLNEVATIKIRGAAGTCFQIGCVTGACLAYLMGLVVHWDYMALIGTILSALCLCVVFLLLPQSPRWLAARRRRPEALAALHRLRAPGDAADGSADFDGELDKLYVAFVREAGDDSAEDDDGTAGCSAVCSGIAGRALLILVVLMLVQQLSGINAVMFYAGGILSDVFPDSTSTANKYALGIQCLQVAVTVISAPLMDKAGRRVLLIVAMSGMIISDACLSIFYLNKNQDNDHLRILAVISLYSFVFSFSCGLGAIPWSLMGELAPIRAKATIAMIVTQTNWLGSFVITSTLTALTQAFGPHGKDENGDDKFQTGRGVVFVIYGAICFVGLIVTILIVPETKGKSIMQVQRDLGGPLINFGRGVKEEIAA